MGVNHLVIGDPHANPDVPNTRFDWLAKLILARKPEKIVCMGDFGDMDSLGHYERGKRDFEGRRYKKDVGAVHDALKRIQKPLEEFNDKQRRNKEKQYHPEMYMLGGNHDEARIERMTQDHAELHDLMSIEDLEYERHGWEYVPFLERLYLDGVVYSHYFTNGNSSFAIGGVNHARQLVLKNHMSSTVGHSHGLQWYMDPRADGRRLHGLVAGWYGHPGFVPKFAKANARQWWSGVVWKKNVSEGDYMPEFITTEEIIRDYA